MKNNIHVHLADFQVAYRFFTKDEGGRLTGTPYQGYRSDWLYDGDNLKIDKMYMIHPLFLNKEGELFEENKSVPTEGIALMKIVRSEMKKYHKERIKVGTKGYFMEGSKKVAEATVTKIF